MSPPAAAFRQQALRETLRLDTTGIPAALVSARRERTPALADLELATPQQAEDPVPVMLPERPQAPLAAAVDRNDDQMNLFQ